MHERNLPSLVVPLRIPTIRFTNRAVECPTSRVARTVIYCHPSIMSSTPAGITLFIITVVFMSVVTVVVILRFWALFSERRRLWLPEYLAIIAYLSLVAHTALEIWTIFNGLGKHTDELTADEMEVLRKFLVAASMTWLANTSTCKLSMLTLYLTLFGICRRLRIAVYITCAIVVAYTITCLPLLIINCPPLAAPGGWYPVPRGSCRAVSRNEHAILVTINILLDCVIAALPVPVLWRLKVPLAKKLSIAGIFLMGLSVVGVLIWRLGLPFHFLDYADLSVATVTITLPGTLEMWLNMIVICLPAIAPIARRYIECLFRCCPCIPLASKEKPDPRGRPEHPARAQHTIGGTPQTHAIGKESHAVDIGASESTAELVGRGNGGDQNEAGPGHGLGVSSPRPGRDSLSLDVELGVADRDNIPHGSVYVRNEFSVTREGDCRVHAETSAGVGGVGSRYYQHLLRR
ncbi:hypothetical protein BDW74DRAFT_83910 [Aspergillus multicolor]|uniref:uncharacterized protein n=1 Tax=Aspergillus multicolor TaxID=41759 RepID=UPI003CCDA245